MNTLSFFAPDTTQAPTYLIAELSANHLGSFERAVETLRAAKGAGADAIKLQTYTPDTMTLDIAAPPFVVEGTLWHGRTLYDLYAEAQTPWEWHAPLRDEAARLGLDFFSSAFDASAVEFLETLAVPCHKVASFELVDLPLIETMAQTGKPLLLSTGMATLSEIEDAVNAAKGAGALQIALLWCNSAYPAPPDEMNLHAIPFLREHFGVPVGLSDHTLGIEAAMAAVALGATIIEKHFTLARSDGGPDSAFSLEPAEFRALHDGVRACEAMLGEARFGPTQRELASLKFRRSLFVVEDIARGEAFTKRNVRAIRPANGAPPKLWPQIEGKTAKRDWKRGEPLEWEEERV